jgi:hypothetical protein
VNQARGGSLHGCPSSNRFQPNNERKFPVHTSKLQLLVVVLWTNGNETFLAPKITLYELTLIQKYMGKQLLYGD